MISVDGLMMSGQRIEVAALNYQLESHYDVVVCGAGSSELVTARRLADPDTKVVLLEAGGLRSPRPSTRQACGRPISAANATGTSHPHPIRT